MAMSGSRLRGKLALETNPYAHALSVSLFPSADPTAGPTEDAVANRSDALAEW